MRAIDQRWYQDRVVLNVLAGSEANARDIFEASEGHVVIGVLSKNYPTVGEAITAMQSYGQAVDDAISIGLGAGDSRQAKVVSAISRDYAGSHINQVFPSVAATNANLGEQESWINSLVAPSGKPGYVNISTGPMSEQEKAAIVPVEAAIALTQDMGGQALKFFPMKGLEYEAEYRAVAQACAVADFGLEPTGGIHQDNFADILKIALEAGVPKIIPHVYSSIIDKTTGNTNIGDVQSLTKQMKQLMDSYV